MITYQLESWAQYYNDPSREALWWEHYNEFSPAHETRMPMAPDLDVYSALDKAGSLMVMTARSQGRLVGYCIVVARRHMHYGALCGFEDAYYLSKEFRQGLAGYKLIKHMLKALERRGVERSYWMTKEFLSIAKLFERLGMVKVDTVYAIWAGG